MDHSSVAGVHRIQSNRSARIEGSLDRSLGQALQRVFPLVAAALNVHHDAWRIIALPHRDLVGDQLKCVGAPTIPSLKRLRCSSAQLVDKEVALRGLGNLEISKLHALNRSEQEISNLTEFPARLAL